MLTANGKAICKINNITTHSNPTFINDGGEERAFVTSGSDTQRLLSLLSDMSIAVGGGATAPVYSDLDLESEIDSLTVVNSTGTNDDSAATYTQNYIAIFTKTYKNETESDVVVSEVGIKASGSPNNFTPVSDFLFARDVISPVTIKPGEAYTFTMYIG